jgi:outer membrane protein TolC
MQSGKYSYQKYRALLSLVCVCVLQFCCIFDAVRADVLTWSDCLKLASTNSTSLQTAREKLFQSETSALAAYGNLYPQISLQGSKQTSTQFSDGHLSDPVNQNSYGLSASQLLFDGFKTWAQKDAAASDYRAAQLDYSVTEAGVRYAVRNAFISLLNAQEQRTLAMLIKERRKQNVEMIRLRYEAGREHRGSLLVAEADLAQAEADVAQSARAIDLAILQLKKECSVPTTEITSVTENEPVAATTADKPDFAAMASANPTLRGLVQRIDSARHNLTAAYANYYPQLSFSYQTGSSGPDRPADNDIWTDSWSTGFSASYTLFDGNQTGANAYKFRSLLRQAQAQALDGRGSVIYLLAQTWTGVQNAQDDQVVRRKYLEAAEERAKIAGAQYASGLIDFNSWTIIEDTLVSARKSYLSARTTLLSAEANWIQAQGGGLNDQK